MKQKLFTFLCLCILCIGSAWGESYTITFSNNVKSATAISATTKASTVIGSGTNYVTDQPFTVNGNCYYGDTQTCIRLGKSGVSASLSIALSEAGQVNATSVVVNCKNLGGTKNKGAKISAFDKEGQTTSDSEADDYTFNLDGTKITSIDLASDKAIYVYSITVNYSKTPVPTKELVSLEVSSTPTKTTYEAGEAFNPTGLVVTGTYDDNSTEEISDGITWSFNPETLTAGTTSVTVTATVGDKTSAAYPVNVTVTAALPKITITDAQVSSFTTTYQEYTWNANNVSGKMFAYKTNGMQFNTTKTGYYVYNIDPIPGQIRSIKMTTHNSGTEREWNVWVSEEPITEEEGVEVQLEKKKVAKTGTTWDVSGNYQYFYLQDNDGASNISEIVITYVPSVDISAAGWATACLPFNATITSNNATAYYVTGINKSSIEKTEANVIPAGEGILLKSNDGKAATVEFTISSDDADPATGNMLKGSLTGETFNETDYTYYILSTDEKGENVGFYWDKNYKENATYENGKAAKCEAGKAVLAVPNTSAGAPSFFTFDDATAINGISSMKASSVRYNLNGQAVGEDYKGIVIVNGKKMFNK